MSFSPAASYPAGTNPQEVVTADFNNDGRLDLAVANAFTDGVNVLLGNGDGTFQPPQASAAGNSPFSLAVGDFNADGKLDLAAGDRVAGGVNAMFGNGDGTFGAPSHVAVGYPATHSVATGDFNNDGKTDLVVTSNYLPADYYSYPQGQADVLLAVGDGSFEARGSWAVADRAFGDAVVADMNGDGKLDLVTELADYSAVIVLLGDGAGNIGNHANAGWPAANANDPSAAGDVNGDGKTDLITSSGLFLGDGTGGLRPTSEYHAAGSGPGTVALGDFDRDGLVDIARGDGLLRNAGNGTFSPVEDFPAGPGGTAVAAGDFNRDGWLDAAATDFTANSAAVFLNDQAWSPAPPAVFVNDVTVTEGNTGTVNATFTVTLSKASASDVTVQYTTSDFWTPSAVAGSDYTAGSGTVTIPAGQTSGTFTVAVIGDRLIEPTEHFFVFLSDPANATITDNWGTGSIVDDEPRFSINSVSRSEGNGKTGSTFTFTVTLSAASDAAVTVNYATANGTATAGTDYQAKAGTVTFAPGETVKTITVLVNGDKVRESNETFFVDVFGAGSTGSSPVRGIGTIWNDDR